MGIADVYGLQRLISGPTKIRPEAHIPGYEIIRRYRQKNCPELDV